MFGVIVTWAFAVGGLVMAVVCAVNLMGLARGWLRTAPFGRIENLGLGLVSAGVAGFTWAFPVDDRPFEGWREYWLLVGAAGLVLMVASEAHRSGEAARVWRWLRQGARMHTRRTEWQPRHLALSVAFVASIFLPSMAPENWWQLVAWIPFLVLAESLRSLPIHCGRAPGTDLVQRG